VRMTYRGIKRRACARRLRGREQTRERPGVNKSIKDVEVLVGSSSRRNATAQSAHRVGTRLLRRLEIVRNRIDAAQSAACPAKP